MKMRRSVFFAAVGVGVLDDPGGLRWPHTTRRGEGTPPYVYSRGQT